MSMEMSQSGLSGVQRTAIVLVALGEQASAEILRKFSDEEVEAVGRAISGLGSVDAGQAEAVLLQFHREASTGGYLRRGGFEFTRRLLTTAFGPDAAKHVTRLMPADSAGPAALDPLRKADSRQLARLVQNEHPQTIALILAHLGPDRAGSLLMALPPAVRADVARRMARLDEIAPDVIARIVAVIEEKLKSFGEIRREPYGGIRAIAEMFNRLDPAAGNEILNDIALEEEALSESVRQMMFVFDDFLSVDSNAIKELFTHIDKKVLMLALKGTCDEMKDRFLQCMSQSGGSMFREDMEAMGPVKIAEVEGAQKQIIALARDLEARSLITLKAEKGQYVV